MSQMSLVKAERALENRAHVRMLLRLRQPAFAAALASAEQDPPMRAPRGAIYPTTGACLESPGRAIIACQSQSAVRRGSGPGTAGPGSGTGRHRLAGGCQVTSHD
jgi:hypothetical protein